MIKRFIVEKVHLLSHQSVVYANDEKEALAKYRRGDVEDEQKPYYPAPKGSKPGAIKVYEGSEQ
jgi:hypothetical protein